MGMFCLMMNGQDSWGCVWWGSSYLDRSVFGFLWCISVGILAFLLHFGFVSQWKYLKI
jgi:hypothetical protein